MLSINPFKKKLPVREEQQYQREQYLPPDLERFRVQPAEPPSFEPPERERKFQAFAREMEPPSPAGFGFEEKTGDAPAEAGFPQNKSIDTSDKLEMVLQKLETIDLRLKLIEQKMERRPI